MKYSKISDAGGAVALPVAAALLPSVHVSSLSVVGGPTQRAESEGAGDPRRERAAAFAAQLSRIPNHRTSPGRLGRPGDVRAGDIGDDPREIELEPLEAPSTIPVPEPAKEPAAPRPDREPVPA